MKQKILFVITFLSLFIGRYAEADVATFSSGIRKEFPWYSYVVLGAFLIIVVSISLLLLAKIKYRNSKNNNQGVISKKQ